MVHEYDVEMPVERSGVWEKVEGSRVLESQQRDERSMRLACVLSPPQFHTLSYPFALPPRP